MNFLFALVLVFIFSVYFQNMLKTSPLFFYMISCLITGTEIIAKLFQLPDIVGDIFYPMFANGIISMAMFTLVMYVGAVNVNSKFHKMISPIRAELSIIASILALGHNFSVGITSLTSLSTWAPLTSRLSVFIILLSFTGIILMVGLLAISFKTVRLMMQKRDWKKVQRLSYLLYTIIFVQILLVSMPLAFEGDSYYIANSIVYSVTFLTYATLRLNKAFKHSKNNQRTKFLYLLAGAYVLVGVIIAFSKATATPADIVLGSTSSIVTTEEPQQDLDEKPVLPQVETQDDNVTDESESEVNDDDTSSTTTIVSGSSGFVIGGSTDIVDDAVDYIIEDDDFIQLLETDFSKFKDGTYVGTGQGKYSIITVSITIQNQSLTEILILDHDETLSKISTTVSLMDEMLEKQMIDVDVVSGATFSSNGIKDAVLEALSTAPRL